jgi:thiamine-monophosphate kinase
LLQEEALIDRYFRDLAARRDDVVLGIGDDAALLAPPPGQRLVAAVDTLNEGVHFPASMPASAVGHRLLAVNLSDLAAMGATPAWATISLSLPAPEEDWLRGFAEGLGALARRHEVALVGGDTVRGPLSLSLQLLGFAPAGEALTRAGAGPGDGIYVTGEPGLAAAGLRRMQASRPLSDPLIEVFLWPRPRVAAGLGLRGIASAAIDVSDGLITDLGRLLGASGCGGRLDAGSLPLSGLVAAGVDPGEALDFALAGGDDYELLFTAPAALAPLLAERSPAWEVEVTRIGEVEEEPGLRVSGGPDHLPGSWRHFDGGAQ